MKKGDETFSVGIFMILVTVISNILTYVSCVSLCKPLVCRRCWKLGLGFFVGVTIPMAGFVWFIVVRDRKRSRREGGEMGGDGKDRMD